MNHYTAQGSIRSSHVALACWPWHGGVDLVLCSPGYLTFAWQRWSGDCADHLGPDFGGIGLMASIWRHIAQYLLPWPAGAGFVTALVIVALGAWLP